MNRSIFIFIVFFWLAALTAIAAKKPNYKIECTTGISFCQCDLYRTGNPKSIGEVTCLTDIEINKKRERKK